MPNFYEEMRRGLLTGSIDTAFFWVPFSGSRYREASGHKSITLPKTISPVMRKIGYGAPFFPTFYQHARKEPLRTFRGAYKGSGTYFITAYSWLVAAEFGVSHAAKSYGLNPYCATFLAGVAGGIIATPGEHYMIQGKPLRQIFRPDIFSFFYSVRGVFPTILRELTFSAVSVSGIQSCASQRVANHYTEGKVNVLTNTIGAVVCAPILAFTQPPARVAATMQSMHLGFFATIRMLNKIGRSQVESLPKNSGLIKQLVVYISMAYFPGGGLRLWTLTGTGLLYGVMDSFFSREDVQPKRSSIMPD